MAKTLKPTRPKSLHPQNLHANGYDFEQLIKSSPELIDFVFVNQFGTQTINFADSLAVLALNKALLSHHYGVQYWDIPAGYLCPPVPGRADYVHYIADLLAESNSGIIPVGSGIKCLDIGVGANCIYPIVGHRSYGWHFVGSDIDVVSVKAASAIVKQNQVLQNGIEIRHQPNKNSFFEGIVAKNEFFHATFCNSPFFGSADEAQENNQRKNRNLGIQNQSVSSRNFGGNANELWCEGGELRFIISMMRESVQFAENCQWFTSLVSKKENLEIISRQLKKLKIADFRIVEMAQGQKVSRLIAWRF